MDAQFKKRVQAVQQTEHGRPAMAAAPEQHSATRHNHVLPTHHAGLTSPTANYTTSSRRNAGGAIRSNTAGMRAARARGPPGTPTGAGISRSIFGAAGNLSSPTTTAAATSSPKRTTGSHLSSPLGVGTRRSSNAGLLTSAANNSSAGVTKKTKASGNTSSIDHNNVDVSANTTNQNNTGTSKAPAGQSGDDPNHSTNHPNSENAQPSKENIATPGRTIRSPNWKSPTKKRIFDSPHDKHMPNGTRRLFSFATTTTHNTMHFDSPSRQIYASTPITQESRNILLSPKKAPRSISKVPFKVLDAPELRGSHLAVGTDSGTIQIWDVANTKRIRTMTGHNQRVGVLAWNDHILTSGSRDRNIYHRDVRSHEMWQHLLSSHSGEVCGLKWNSAGTQLASGGNDNRLMVWEKDATVPIYKFRDHIAAVKALDWNPHQSGVLASGGGTADRHIRFWNTTLGTAISATDTGSQVCNLAWSKTTNELVSTHGYSQNQVLVWKYPTMQQIASLSGHTRRVLYLALSPDGQTIVTGAGDETLRFWNVFQKNKSERKDDEGFIGTVATIR
ncbi:substrate-specific activator of APC-dependent proteolysis [Mortierella sp. GBA43]|nr:substrate-specific activator of APC-dependent proteolysis [Mortierella sp. GBA43]